MYVHIKFHILSFSYYSVQFLHTYCILSVCKSCDGKNDNNRKSKQNELKEIPNERPNEKHELENNDGANKTSTEKNPDKSENENPDIGSGGADTEKKDNTKNWYCKYIVWWVFQVFCIPLTYLFCLRPIISTFTFLFRSFTYFVFVALPIRAHILRYTMLIVTTVTYFVKYFHEIVNMNADILKQLFTCSEEKIHVIDEEMFDYVYKRLMFVRKKLYFMFLKMIVLFMYLFITIETFITNKSSLTGSSFKDILEFLLIIIGPYAISLFLKVNREDFLTEENKTEIKHEYDYYIMSDKKVDNKTKEKTQERSTSQNQSPGTDGKSARTPFPADTNADDQNTN